MKYFITLSGLLLLIHFSAAQSPMGFVEGTIYKKNGDSIRCLVERSLEYTDWIAYKFTPDEEEKRIAAKKIIRIKLPFKQLENVTIAGVEKLMVMVVEGKINLYSYIEQQFGEAVPDSKLKGGTYQRIKMVTHYIVKKDNSYSEIKNVLFTENMRVLLAGCAALISDVENQLYDFRDMEKIITEYNTCSQ